MTNSLSKQRPTTHSLIFRRRLFFFIIKLIPIPTLRKRLRNSPFLSRNKQKFLKDFNFEKRIIYQKSIQTYKAPDLTEARNCGLEKEFSQNFFDSIEHIPEYAVHKIPNGFVFGEEGYILTENRTLLRDYTAQKYHPKRSLHPAGEKDLSKLKKIHIEGNVAVITPEVHSHNYYHFTRDGIPRFHLLNKSQYKIDKIYANSDFKYQKEIFEILGVSEKIIPAGPNIIVSAKNIIAPSLLNNFRVYKTGNFEYSDAKYVIEWRKEFCLQSFHSFVKKDIAIKKIYISRKRAPGRKILNEDELLPILLNKNFKILFLEDLSFIDQMSYFYNAEIILSPHGAGLENLVHCKANAKVIELLSEDYLANPFFLMSQTMQLDYHYLICKTDSNHRDNNPRQANILVDIEKLNKLL